MRSELDGIKHSGIITVTFIFKAEKTKKLVKQAVISNSTIMDIMLDDKPKLKCGLLSFDYDLVITVKK